MSTETCRHAATVVVKIRGVYDGGLYFECLECGERLHRWPKGHYLRAKAEPFVNPPTCNTVRP